MNIGVTLLFFLQENDIAQGILKSYIIKCTGKDDFYHIIADKVKQHSGKYQYIGIEDVFSVSGEAKVGEVIGRSTLYNIQNRNNAKELVNKNRKFSYLNNEEDVKNSYLCVSLVYFYEDIKSINYTLTALTLVENTDIEKVVQRTKEIAQSKPFLNKLKNLSVSKMYVSKIKYIGIEDIYLLKEDVGNGGAFQVHKNTDIQSLDELLKILPTEAEIGEMLNDIIV